MNYDGIRATVMGLGRFGGGVAAARWLARAGAQVTVTDTAPPERLAPSLRALSDVPIKDYVLGGHRDEDFLRTDLVVVNPAVRPGSAWVEMAQSAGAKTTSETELFLEACRGRTVGVTGTNGKSTTAAMIAAILTAQGHRVWLGGNIGRSLLGEIDSIAPDDFVVIELSSFQLYWLGPGAPMPQTAAVTNFVANHLDWHTDRGHYRAAKQRILTGQQPGDIAVFDPHAQGLADWQSAVRGQFVSPQTEEAMPLLVPGRHNRANAALAVATARNAGCCEEAILEGLSTFRGLPDRLELLGTARGRRFVNDSSATTPESTMAALAALEGPLWLLAGGADKGADLEPLAEQVAHKAAGTLFYGMLGPRLADMVRAKTSRVFCESTSTLSEAFALCMQHAPAGATIVLSPGCSSHDQFDNYRHRGAAFAELVAALPDYEADTPPRTSSH